MSTSRTLGGAALVALAALALGGCSGDDDPPAAEALFPESYATTYQEVRGCRRSGDHDLLHVRVLADPTALEAYTTRAMPFPEGSTLLKEEYLDDACTMLDGWTAMRREAGFDPAAGDWHWQRVELDRSVSEDGQVARCRSCHAACGLPPDGHDGTCTVP